VASFTALISIRAYFGYMQPLRKTDVFGANQTQILDNQPWTPRAEDTFDTVRGLLTAAVLGLPLWAGMLLLGWWIWL